VYRNYTEIKDR